MSSHLEEMEYIIKSLYCIFDKKIIRENSEIRDIILSLIKTSNSNPKYKYICTKIIETL